MHKKEKINCFNCGEEIPRERLNMMYKTGKDFITCPTCCRAIYPEEFSS